MIRKLLIVMAGGALVSVACFTAVNMMGGLRPPAFFMGDHDWGDHGWVDAGPPVTRDLPWSGGARLDVNYPAEIVFTQAPQPRFTVTGPKALVDSLRLEDGSLTAYRSRRFHFGHRHHGRLKVEVASPDTHEFHLSGAEKLSLRNYDQDTLILRASGAADVEGQGRARRLEARISGAGHLDLEALPVDEAEVSISGAGDASLDPRTSADISISGAGHVDLKTRPPNLRTHISGFGSVETPEGRVK